MRSVHIWSFSGPCFFTFGLNTVKYGKMETRKTPNTDTFHAVLKIDFLGFEILCHKLLEFGYIFYTK